MVRGGEDTSCPPSFSPTSAVIETPRGARRRTGPAVPRQRSDRLSDCCRCRFVGLGFHNKVSFVVVNYRLVVRRHDPPVAGRPSDVNRASYQCPVPPEGGAGYQPVKVDRGSPTSTMACVSFSVLLCLGGFRTKQNRSVNRVSPGFSSFRCISAPITPPEAKPWLPSRSFTHPSHPHTAHWALLKRSSASLAS